MLSPTDRLLGADLFSPIHCWIAFSPADRYNGFKNQVIVSVGPFYPVDLGGTSMEHYIIEPQRKTPVAGATQVLVAGGGMAGIAAALAAAAMESRSPCWSGSSLWAVWPPWA